MTVYQISVQPLEPLLFGDNRSARAGVDHVLQDQDPSPLTLHGALGQAVVSAARSSWPQAVLGEKQPNILAPTSPVASLLGYCLRAPGGDLFFPRPGHLRCVAGAAGSGGVRPEPHDLLAPQEVSGFASSVQPVLPGLIMAPDVQGEEEVHELSSAVLLGESALGEVLSGHVPEGGLSPASDLFRAEPRPGIAVDNRDGRVMEGAFFTRPYRRFAAADLDPEAGCGGFTAWLETLEPLTEDEIPDRAFVGGDRRRARLSFDRLGDERSLALSRLRRRVEKAAEETDTRGFFLYLLSPALAQHELPPWAGQPPLAAVLGRPGWISGWDTVRRQPRELRTVVPAGSVVFYHWPGDGDRAELVRDAWLGSWAEDGAAAGFGRTLVGVWR